MRQKSKTKMYKVHVSYKSVSKALTKAQASALKNEIKRRTKGASVVIRAA